MVYRSSWRDRKYGAPYAFRLLLIIQQINVDNEDKFSQVLNQIEDLNSVLRVAIEKMKELDRHGVPLADLKCNIETLLGSVMTILIVFLIADTDAEILGSLGTYWRTTRAEVELCDSCLQRRISAIWPSCPTGYVMLLTILLYDYITLLV